MTYPNFTPTQENHGTAQPHTRAQAAAERYTRAAPRPADSLGRVRLALLMLGAGVLLGAGAAFSLSAEAGDGAPLAGAVRVINAEVTIANDDSRAFLVSGWIVRLPSPNAQGQGE